MIEFQIDRQCEAMPEFSAKKISKKLQNYKTEAILNLNQSVLSIQYNRLG